MKVQFKKLCLVLQEFFIDFLMTLTDDLTLSKSEKIYQGQMAEILEPQILEYFNKHRATKEWTDNYSQLKPYQLLVQMSLLEVTELSFPYREIYRFIRYIEEILLTPFQLSKKTFKDTGYSLPVERFWAEDNSLHYQQAIEVHKLLTSKLEYIIYYQLQIPSYPPTFYIDEDWRLLLEDGIESERVYLIILAFNSTRFG